MTVCVFIGDKGEREGEERFVEDFENLVPLFCTLNFSWISLWMISPHKSLSNLNTYCQVRVFCLLVSLSMCSMWKYLLFVFTHENVCVWGSDWASVRACAFISGTANLLVSMRVNNWICMNKGGCYVETMLSWQPGKREKEREWAVALTAPLATFIFSSFVSLQY